MVMRDSNKVVLFINDSCGTVVSECGEGEDSDRIGDYCEFWEISLFTDFYGTVTLSND